MAPFRKNQDVVAAINGFSGVSEALAETSVARQRKQIQERHAQEPLQTVKHPMEQTSTQGWSTQRLKGFAPGRSGKFVPNASRERGKNESDIDIADVIANHQDWSFHTQQVFASINFRPTQYEHRRPQQQIVHKKT